ncbi:hypothetical protein SpCBS45565_g01808 [Spizellomyces sp. 'palustris']|nr:hypothetical protein SpCBS45565_g01808 [Spizellomyces sp. 'palustris']
MSSKSPPPTILYKILTVSEHEELQLKNLAFEPYWRGTSLDHTDGFIHLSNAKQAPIVADRFYQDQAEIVLLKIPYTLLQESVKFELPCPPGASPEERLKLKEAESKEVENGESELFPHFYGELDLSAESLEWEIVNRTENGFKESMSRLKW